jgi:hypothetical protein
LHLKIRGASEKFKNQPRHLIRPGSVNFRQHYGNPSHATVPLKKYLFVLLLWSRNEVHKPQQWLDKGKKKAVREEPCVAGPDSWINFRGSWGNIKKMVR